MTLEQAARVAVKFLKTQSDWQYGVLQRTGDDQDPYTDDLTLYPGSGPVAGWWRWKVCVLPAADSDVQPHLAVHLLADGPSSLSYQSRLFKASDIEGRNEAYLEDELRRWTCCALKELQRLCETDK